MSIIVCPMAIVVALSVGTATPEKFDLTRATVVIRPGERPQAERSAARVLVEEAEARTGILWPVQEAWPESGPIIVVAVGAGGLSGSPEPAPEFERSRLASLPVEGFVLTTRRDAEGRPIVRILGVDPRGALFGVGKLLRTMDLERGSAAIAERAPIGTSPAYPIRGHQLGYRNRANSWDAWDEKQFDRYIRELAIFGANCVENIPFQDDDPGPLMKLPREVMNVKLSEICHRYDQDYWLWTPADFDLGNPSLRAGALKKHEALYRQCPRLDAVFFPGGDPGDNPPRLVLPFLREISTLLQRYHPRAKVWLSLQGFEPDQAEEVYQYLDREKPDWFGGIVCGPSSPPIPRTRRRLERKYPIRHYPDITHNVRAEYPIPWWDPALAFTLGREAINPRPVQYAAIHNALAPDTAGFLSYSDGVHDDVNKVVWNAMAWDPETQVRDILVDYSRFFFGPGLAEPAADGILALERNWIGPLRENGGVEASLALWQRLEKESSGLAENWRWQMCQVRAAYDAYTRRRLIEETRDEDRAVARLLEARRIGPEKAIERALDELDRPRTRPTSPDLRRRIEDLCDALYRSIGLQTSIKKHRASGAERGCILDFVDHPLNNRWWLEDEMRAIAKRGSGPETLTRLEQLGTWEHPGAGSFYDQVGYIGRSPHVIRGDITSIAPDLPLTPIPEVLWWEDGASRKKPAWMVVMNWPVAMKYGGLDPMSDYVIRTTGFGTCLLSVDGRRIRPRIDGKGIGEFKEFAVPRELLEDGAISLTFERPVEHVNWRHQSRLSELWVLKLKR